MTSVIGVDPGATGAAAFIDGSLLLGIMVIRFGKLDYHEIATWFRKYDQGADAKGFIEQVGSRPSDDPYTAMKFGVAIGFAQGCFICNEIDLSFVTPTVWQLEFALGGKQGPPGCTRDQEYTARKQAHQRKAQALFPQVKVTRDMADAMLIAEYGRRKVEGVLTHGRNSEERREAEGIDWNRII